MTATLLLFSSALMLNSCAPSTSQQKARNVQERSATTLEMAVLEELGNRRGEALSADPKLSGLADEAAAALEGQILIGDLMNLPNQGEIAGWTGGKVAAFALPGRPNPGDIASYCTRDPGCTAALIGARSAGYAQSGMGGSLIFGGKR